MNQAVASDFVRVSAVPLLAALLLAGMAELGLFRLTNGILFDVAVSRLAPGTPMAVLVRVPPAQATAVARRSIELGALQVMLLSPVNVRSPLPRNTTIGVEPARVPGTRRWALPPGASGRSVAAVATPRPELGVARRFRLSLPGRQAPIRTVEGVALSASAKSAASGIGGERFIRLPATATVPILTGRQLLGSLPPGALNGMRVLVGPLAANDPPRFLVSALPGSPVLGSAEFHARAVHAVVAGRTASLVAGIQRLVLLLGAALALTALLLWTRIGWRTASAAAAVFAIAVVGVAAVAGGHLLPVTEFGLLALVAAGAVSRSAHLQRQRQLELLADQGSAHLSHNSLMPDPRQWTEFFPAAARLSGAERSLLVEEQPDGSFVPLAASADAAAKAVATLDRSPGFDRADVAHPRPVPASIPGRADGWIARLNHPGRPGVYWLFGAGGGDERTAVLRAATRLAARASELPALALGKSVGRAQESDRRLYAAVGGVVGRSGELRKALGALQTAAMLFDAAGVPMQANAAMERLLRKIALQPTRATPVDVAAGLAGLAPDDARRMLGGIVRHGGDLRLASQAEIGGRRFDVRVLDVDGDLLFEATDVTHLQRLAGLQRELAGQIDARIRNDLEAIDLALRLATDERLPVERRQRALSMVGQASSRTRGTLDELERLVDASIYTDELEPYPLNPRSALIRAAHELQPAATRAGVHLTLEQPGLASLVLAEPEMLDQLLATILEMCLGDSPRGSAITAELHESEATTRLSISGGFGLPAERFAAALSAEPRQMVPAFRVLHRARQLVPAWGGAFEVASEAGGGYRFTISLRRA